jgi:hypothetical protein
MAVDGFNSFLLDFGRAHLYEPRNWLRLGTGMSAGVVLGFALCFLMASSIWQHVDTRRQTLEDWRVMPIIGLIWLPVALAVGSGFGPLYVPLTLLLVFAAGLALTMLALVVLVILRRRDFTFAGVDSLGSYGVGAIGLAMIAMAVLAVGRWLLEQSIGGPPAM